MFSPRQRTRLSSPATQAPGHADGEDRAREQLVAQRDDEFHQ